MKYLPNTDLNNWQVYHRSNGATRYIGNYTRTKAHRTAQELSSAQPHSFLVYNQHGSHIASYHGGKSYSY